MLCGLQRRASAAPEAPPRSTPAGAEAAPGRGAGCSQRRRRERHGVDKVQLPLGHADLLRPQEGLRPGGKRVLHPVSRLQATELGSGCLILSACQRCGMSVRQWRAKMHCVTAGMLLCDWYERQHPMFTQSSTALSALTLLAGGPGRARRRCDSRCACRR